MDFTVPVDHRVKIKENETRDKYLDLTRELLKTLEYEGDCYTNFRWGLAVGDVGTVSIVKIVSLSSCRKTKLKKLINVSYLN